MVRTRGTRNAVRNAHSPSTTTDNATVVGSSCSTSASSPPLPDSLEPARPRAERGAPAAGGVVRRMRWTHDMNINVMRAYYRATEGGTNLTTYRVRLLSEFQILEPTIQVSDQRLADQVRVIRNRKFLDDNTLAQLQREALPSTSNIQDDRINQIDLSDNNSRINNITSNNVTPGQNNLTVSTDDINIDVEGSVSPHRIEYIRKVLEDAILQYRFVNPLQRPYLPKLTINKNIMKITKEVNNLLLNYFGNISQNLSDIHSFIYCGAFTVIKLAGIKIPPNTTNHRLNNCKKPAWQLRIENKINSHRTLLAKLISFKSGNTRPRVMRFVTKAFQGTGTRPQDFILKVTERIDDIKQKISAWAKRIRRYKTRVNRYIQNRTFQTNEKRVYRGWECRDHHGNDHDADSHADKEDSLSFWRSLWSDPCSHSEGTWMSDVEEKCKNIAVMKDLDISIEDMNCAIRKLSNWKAPGLDGLHNFWIKWFTTCHGRLATLMQEALEEASLPTFLTTGITHLIYKGGSTRDPKNYRPITCLPTLYKLLTSIVTQKITEHIIDNKILSISQNGCRKGSRGTKELLLIDMVICRQVKRKRKSMSAAWIDYKKAFDSVPHSWLRKILQLYKINVKLYNFLDACMSQWCTFLSFPGSRLELAAEDKIEIRRGIFQGDSLSPLWFCLALNPLSTLLEDSGLGYQLRRGGTRISHLFYMDDLKLVTSRKPDLVELLNITEKFSSSIEMEFGIEKCAVIHIERGRVVLSDGLQLSDSITFRALSEVETYKYLGISQSLDMEDRVIKQNVLTKFYQRLKIVLNSLLSGVNKIRAYNSWVMPVLLYTFGILRWSQTEIVALDRKVRTLLTSNRMHHPRSSMVRLYIPRKCGGRGMLHAQTLHNCEVCNLRNYFLGVDNPLHKDVVKSDAGFTPLSLSTENWRSPVILTAEDREAEWKSKSLHGRFYRALHGEAVDHKASVHWLRFGDLFGETEGFVCAIQDEVVKTNNYRKYILKDGTADICRACHRPGESIRHIISGCSQLANGEYLHRHNLVARIIHQQLALAFGLVDAEVPYYQYVPQPVLDNSHAKLYWDRSIITDRHIVANKPDIVIMDRIARRATIVDISVPHDDNLIQAEKDKMIKYIDLAHEITDMWEVDSTIVVPVVVSANGLIAKSLDQHLQRLSLSNWIKAKIQKAVLLDTTRIVRRFLSLGTDHR